MMAMLLTVSTIDPEDAKDEAVKALVVNFLRRRNEDIQRIREALVSESFDVIATIGHNLRGNGASYGFAELSTIGESIEKSAVASDAAAVLREVDRLIAELARIDADRTK